MRRGKVTAAGTRPRRRARRPSWPGSWSGGTVLETGSNARRSRPGAVVLSRGGRRGRERQRPARPCATSRSRSGPARSSASPAVAGNGQSELAEVITGLRPCRGRVTVDGRGDREPAGRRGDPARGRPRPRGPDRRGQRARPVARRQPDHEGLPAGADRPRLGHRHGRRAPDGDRPQGRLRDRGADDRHRRPGSCPAATSSGSSSRARSTPHPRLIDRRPAHPRPRRRCHRDASTACCSTQRDGGCRDPADLRGPRRDPRPVRPGRRDVRGPDRRPRSTPPTATSHEIGLLMTGGDRGRRPTDGEPGHRRGRGPPRRSAAGSPSACRSPAARARLDTPRWLSPALTLGALVVALVISGRSSWHRRRRPDPRRTSTS